MRAVKATRQLLAKCFESNSPKTALWSQLVVFVWVLLPSFIVLPCAYLASQIVEVGLRAELCKILVGLCLAYALLASLFYVTMAVITCFHWFTSTLTADNKPMDGTTDDKRG